MATIKYRETINSPWKELNNINLISQQAPAQGGEWKTATIYVGGNVGGYPKKIDVSAYVKDDDKFMIFYTYKNTAASSSSWYRGLHLSMFGASGNIRRFYEGTANQYGVDHLINPSDSNSQTNGALVELDSPDFTYENGVFTLVDPAGNYNYGLGAYALLLYVG